MGSDLVRWDLEPSGRTSVASMYRKLAQGASVAHCRDVWSATLPLKIKIFTWQLALDRLPTCSQLAKHLALRNEFCSLCGQIEDASHIFFLVF